jgi:capsular exopolysaccharide synthesis family protein
VRSADEVERLTGLPVLGVVLDDPLLRQSRTIIVGTGTAPNLEENLRAVASNLVFALSEETEPIVVFTGLNPGDGKSTVTANIAVALSELGLRVRLVDADLRKPVQHEVFRVPNRRGLSDTLRADIAPAELSLPTRFPGLTVVPAGPPLTAQRDELNVYLHRLGKFHAGVDVTVVDSPPLRASEAVRLLATQSNAQVLVVRPGGPPRELRAAVDSVRRVGINVVGVVINRAKRGAAETGALPYYGYDHAAGHVAGGDPERPAAAHRSDDARTLSEAVAEAVGAPGRAAPPARPGPGGNGPATHLGG